MKTEKAIFTKAERENHPLNGAALIFKWTVSRGRETYGYNICSLYIRNSWDRLEKVASVNGGGYDMRGACLAQYIQVRFVDQLKKLTANYGSLDNRSGFYGLCFYNKASKRKLFKGYATGYQKHYTPGASVHLDGACGFSTMERILYKIGFVLEYAGHYPGSRDNSIYIMRAR